MKRPIALITYVMILLVIQTGYSQDWPVALTVDPYPSPYLSDWQADPTLAALEITNPTAKPDVVIVDLEVRSAEGARFQGYSQRLLINPDQTLLMNTTEFAAWYTGALDQTARDKAVRTGMMPEGSYEACIRIRNLWGSVLAQNVCAYFTIAHPDPPELIYPADGQEMSESYPVFQWIPPHFSANQQAVYVFRLVRMLQGQTPDMALAANFPHHENFNLQEANLEYPADALPLEANARYAWQVQALDLDGKPVTKNEGRSPIFSFTTSSELQSATATLQLSLPENQAYISTYPVEFQWLEPVAGNTGQFRYDIHIVAMGRGQTPEQALRENVAWYAQSAIIDQTRWIYPPEAPPLAPGMSYAWQVQARDEFGVPALANEGLSEIWTFTTALAPGDENLVLAEHLPIVSESIAYIQLFQNGKPAAHFTFSPDSAQVQLDGPMTLVLPALQTGLQPPQFTVNGQLTFDRSTLQISSGQIQGSLAPEKGSPLNLEASGTPLIITQVAYSSGQLNRLDLQAVPVLFGRIAASTPVQAYLTSDGFMEADIAVFPAETIDIIPNSDRLQLTLGQLAGTVHAAPAGGLNDNQLVQDANLVLNGATPAACLPVSLQFDEKGAEIRTSISSQQTTEIDLGKLNLGLSDISCHALRYNAVTQTWSFDLGFDLIMDFPEMSITLPQIHDVHMSRLGIEIPGISIADLGEQTAQSISDLWITPRAFRMYAYTFDWCRWKGGDIGDWGFFWDLDIQLPGLPAHLSAIDAVPLRANNATWINGIFQGKWNPRAFAPPLFVPMTGENVADSTAWGLNIHEIRGAFATQQGVGPDIGVKADWVPPQQVTLNASGEITFEPEQLTLSPKGVFKGTLTSLNLSNPIAWGAQLSIQSQTSALIFDENQGRQQASLRLNGTVTFPAPSGKTVTASGEGVLNLFTWRLSSGKFTVNEAFTVALPYPNHLLALVSASGAVVDPAGLHLIKISPTMQLSQGESISGQSEGEVLLSLPEWTMNSGNIRFSNTFALSLSDWRLGKEKMTWQTRSIPGDAQSGSDNLFLPLPSLPRLDGPALIASGSSQAALYFKNQRHALAAEFSNDFLFTLTPPAVKRGQVQFSSAGQQVAVLDSNGLHLGEYFGVTLASEKIGLPDTSTAYIDMAANPNLMINDENGLKHIRTAEGKLAAVCFPSLKYRNAVSPCIQAEVDLLIDPTTHVLVSGTIHGEGAPLLSLADGQVPLRITQLDFASGKWTASLQPILPMALGPDRLTIANVSVNASGLQSFDSGYSSFTGAPQDTAVLGEYLSVTLDGVRAVCGGQLPQIGFSGDLRTPLFSGYPLHFTCSLTTDSASFSLKTLNVEPPLGCGRLLLNNQDGLPAVAASMSQPDFTLALHAVWKLDSLSTGFALTLPRLEISGTGVSLKQAASGTEPQSFTLYGTRITLKTCTLKFTRLTEYDLLMDGSMLIFGKSVDFAGLRLANGCSIADAKLAQIPDGLVLNPQISLQNIETRSGILQPHLKIFLPQPFDTSSSDTTTLAILPDGSWVDHEGNVLPERKFSREREELGSAPRLLLGNEDFHANAYLSAIALGIDGADNTGSQGSIDYRVDVYWPSSDINSAADSVCIPTIGLCQFTASSITSAWSISQDAPDDTITSVLAKNTYMHAATFSMGDSAAYVLHFNCIMQLPLPSDMFNVQWELTDNQIGPGTYQKGSFHTIEAHICGLTFEMTDFHLLHNQYIDYEEISYTRTTTSTTPKRIWANTYFSFGVNLATDIPGICFGVERLLYFESGTQVHFMLKHLTGWVGDYFFMDLELYLSYWAANQETGEKTQFKWMIGGNVDIKTESPIKGCAVVGEVSYRKVIGLDRQETLLPGFGFFFSANVEIDLKPIPVELLGLGAGFFFNPSREIRDMVYYHTMGYDELENKEICEEFREIMDSMQDDMMTAVEIYLFGAGAIPDDSMLQAKILLTLASDRIKINAKVWPSEATKKEKLEGIMDLAGFLEAECAWSQDFGKFKYLAGSFKFGGRASVDESYILKCPEAAQAKLDFIVLAGGEFGISGRLMTQPLGCAYLAAECEFTFGNAGFVFYGRVATGYDIMILRIEAGMELSMYLKWYEPVKFGIYADCYVEGSIIDDWLAGFRGEMGAALMVEPELFLYGYAELKGTILGVSKTIRVWVKWEDGGGMSSGTGSDPTLEQLVAESQALADEIMTNLQDFKAELALLGVLSYGNLTAEDISKIVANIGTGKYDDYIRAWDVDFPEFGKALVDEIDKVVDFHDERMEKASILLDKLIGVRDALANKGLAPLYNDIKAMEPYLADLRTSLQNRVSRLKGICDTLYIDMNTIDFSLDTLLVLADVEASPIQNPLQVTYSSLEGVRVPVINLDESIEQHNAETVEKLQQVLEGWLAKVDANMRKMVRGREAVYGLIGPGSDISTVQAEIFKPMLSANSEFTASVRDLNASFSTCYGYYGNIPAPWDTDEFFQVAAQNDKHCRASNTRREETLTNMEIPLGSLPFNAIDRYRTLGNLFYRTMPAIALSHYLLQADSLMKAFAEAASGLQDNLDKIHQNFTANTDQLWDKYAELSEKVYSMLDLYQTTVKNLPGSGEGLSLKDSTAIILSRLKNEFSYPAVNPAVSVNQNEGFMPVTAVLDCQSSQPEQIAEYAVSLNGNAFQSMGTDNRLERDYTLKSGVSYWIESYDEESVGWPMVAPEKRTISLAPRLRNRAGLTTISGTTRIDMAGKDWKYEALPNQIHTPMKTDSIYRCLEVWPYARAALSGQEIYFCSATDELTLQWHYYHNYGIWSFPPAPARHRITLKQGDRIVFGPEDFPVTGNSSADTFQVRLQGLQLSAGSGEPCRAIIEAYDVTGVLIGTSSGATTIHAQKDDGTIYSVEQKWTEPLLYIDSTPPVITGTAAYLNIGDNNYVIYKLPKAKNEVRLSYGTYSEWISEPAAYEYQLLPWNGDADSSSWLNLANAGLLTSLPATTLYNQDLHTLANTGSDRYSLNFAPAAFADSLKLVMRAKNPQAYMTTGYSDPAAFLIPKADESKPPAPAQFRITGLDKNKNLEIEILQAGSDDQSGVSHYPWKLSQNLYKSANPEVTVWHPQILRFTADTVRNGVLLTIPIPHDSIDSNNSFTVELFTFDRCGNCAATQQTYYPEPPAPQLSARLVEGLKPFKVMLSGAIQPLSENYIDSVAVHIGTVPDSSDLVSRFLSFTELAQLLQGSDFNRLIELPESVAEGTSIYLSIFNIRHGLWSRPYTQRIQIYRPLFATVDTDANGYLVLPIQNSAFNGQREATYKWGMGYLAPQLPEPDRYQLNLQPLTDLQGYSSDQIIAGAEIRLPIKAADVRPRSLVVLQATALNGEVHATYREIAIIPPPPEVKALFSLDESEYNRFFYRLNIQTRFGAGLQDHGQVVVKIGTKSGASDLQQITLPLVSYLQDGFTSHQLFLDSTTAKYSRIYLTGFSKTAVGTDSRDSTLLSFDVPWPMFWKEPKVTFDGYLSIQPVRSGCRDANEISGYQFAIGDGAGSTFNLRPYPASLTAVDIAAADWIPGKTVPLNYRVQDLPYETYRVGIRAVRRTGQTHEEIHVSKPFLQPRVNAEILGAFPPYKLHVQTDLGPEMAAQMSMKELRLELTLNGASQFYRTFTIPDNGSFDMTYDLPMLRLCQTYQFKSFFWHTASQQFASYVTELDMPCPPLFTVVDADSDDRLYLDLINSAFSGTRPLAGYQFAIGSSAGMQDIRPQPQQGQWDFTPEQAGAGNRLTLPQSLIGLPASCYVSLKGFDQQGKIHTTEQLYQARPPQPKVTVLYMDNSGRFTVRFDQSRFDAKVRYLNCWIKSAQDPDHVIAFNEFQNADLQSGIVKFDSQFTPNDVDQEFIFEGLSLGYQINSLEFKYRFRITKVGDSYRVLAL